MQSVRKIAQALFLVLLGNGCIKKEFIETDVPAVSAQEEPIIVRVETRDQTPVFADEPAVLAEEVAAPPVSQAPQPPLFGEGVNPFWGPQFVLPPSFEPLPPRDRSKPRVRKRDWLFEWNQIAIDASGLDHTPVRSGENRVFGEQLGPTRAGRAMAIVHIALFEAINAIEGGYKSYINLDPARGETSLRAAMAYAAHDTLVALFPSQKATFDEELMEELSHMDDSDKKERGIELGKKAAALILALRANDQSNHPEPHLGIDFFPKVGIGYWSQDPIGLQTVALGANWSLVTPFVMNRADQFRAPPPPPLTSQAYTDAFNETKAVGGDGVITPTIRTPEQTEIGIFWAYDGTPSLCAPPRLYNQIAVHIAKQEGSKFVETARLLALLNVAMADAGIASWESKYFYEFWRPVTAIRGAASDGNPSTVPDPTFTPLGAPASNLTGPNFTPPFPAYTSGHATFGGAIFQILRKFYGRDDIAFTVESDEFNGKTRDNEGRVRPKKSRSFKSFSQAEEENGQSRMYLGIHWAFDKTEGIAQGQKVGDLVWETLFRPK